MTEPVPPPGSPGEIARFRELQAQLGEQFREVFPSKDLPRTVIVVPSVTLDTEVLQMIPGASFYEERLLCLLMLLRLPHTRIIYLTSVGIHPTIVDYYLNLLAGVPASHARSRLVLLSCHDDSPKPLTEKVLARPRLLRRIRDQIQDPRSAHITTFTSTPLERTLAVRLGIPLYACDPALSKYGNKSHGREILKEAGVPVPDGVEHLRDVKDMTQAIYDLKRKHPNLNRAVVKLNDGFSGEGNALLSFEGAPRKEAMLSWIRAEIATRLTFESKTETWERFHTKFAQMGGVVECFLEGKDKRSPNARYRITPAGDVEVISTQDQILGGPSGQIYLACRFPSDEGYRREIQEMGLRISKILRDRGVLGQVGHDFICFRKGDGWEHYGIELNIRKGGATHPFIMLQYLTKGNVDPETGLFRTPAGEERCFIASDNVQKDAYAGLTPDDLIDIAVENNIHFQGSTQQGVVFHLIGALSRFGKLGLVCIDRTPEGAEKRYQETISILDREAAR